MTAEAVRSRTFCFCVPVRFGVFIMSTLFLICAATIGAVGCYSATHKEQAHLTRNQEVSVVIVSISYTVLAIISLFGLIGAIIKRRSFVFMYSSIVSWHLGCSLVTGAYFIYTLYHKVGEQDVNNCIAENSSDDTKVQDCKAAFDFIRGITIGIYIVFWLFELWGCLVVADYVAQLREEDEGKDEPGCPPPAEMAASAPPLATTYNYRHQYSFSAPKNSYGRQDATNV